MRGLSRTASSTAAVNPVQADTYTAAMASQGEDAVMQQPAGFGYSPDLHCQTHLQAGCNGLAEVQCTNPHTASLYKLRCVQGEGKIATLAAIEGLMLSYADSASYPVHTCSLTHNGDPPPGR